MYSQGGLYQNRALVSKYTSELDSQSLSVYIIYSQGGLYQNRALVSKDTSELGSQSVSVYVILYTHRPDSMRTMYWSAKTPMNWAVSQSVYILTGLTLSELCTGQQRHQ